MTTKLDGTLKREVSVQGEPYSLTISPDGLNLVPKGRRKGQQLRWIDLVSGDAALATALYASLARAPPARRTKTAKAPTKPAARKSTEPQLKSTKSRRQRAQSR